MKKKKELTVKQQANRYRVFQYLANGGEVVSILTPFITLGIINFEEWFTVEEGWKVGLGGALALALAGIAVFMFAKKKEGKAITNGWITGIVGWFAVAFILFLLASIIHQISTIMMWGGLGLIGAAGLDTVSKRNKAIADAYKQELAASKQETLKERIRKEIEEENKKKGLI